LKKAIEFGVVAASSVKFVLCTVTQFGDEMYFRHPIFECCLQYKKNIYMYIKPLACSETSCRNRKQDVIMFEVIFK